MEGQMDFLMSWQSNIKYVVATSGTALTEDQLRILKRITNNLIIGYDMDEAGQLAAERAIDMAHLLDFHVSIINLPEGKDIADYALLHQEKLSKIIDRAKEATDYYYNKALTQYNLRDINDKRKALEFLLSKIVWIDNPIEKGEWLKKIADDFQIKEEFLQEELEKIQKTINKNEVKINTPNINNSHPLKSLKSRKELLSEKVLALAIKNKSEKIKITEIEKFLPDQYKNIAEILIKSDNLTINNENPNLLENTWESISYLQLLADYEFTNDEEIDWNLEFEKIIGELKKETLKELLAEKTSLLKKAETNNDTEKIDEYLNDIQKLSKGNF